MATGMEQYVLLELGTYLPTPQALLFFLVKISKLKYKIQSTIEVCIPGSFGALFFVFFQFFYFFIFLLKQSICNFLTPFILLIHSVYNNIINFSKCSPKSQSVTPVIHTTLTCHNKIITIYCKITTNHYRIIINNLSITTE